MSENNQNSSFLWDDETIDNDPSSVCGNWKCNDRSEYRIEIENESFVMLFLNRKNFQARIIGFEPDKEYPDRLNIILDTYDIMAGNPEHRYLFQKITSLYVEPNFKGDSIMYCTLEIVPEYYNDRIESYTFSKTNESRYGDVIMHPEIIQKIQGKWKSDEYWSFEIRGNIMIMDDCENKIVAYTYRRDEMDLIFDKDKEREIIIDNEDAGRHGNICGLIRWRYKGNSIEATMEVMDADHWPTYVFEKEND